MFIERGFEIRCCCSENHVRRLSTHIRIPTDQVAACFCISPISTAILVPVRFPEDASYQPSISRNMSQAPTAGTSSSNYQSIFDNAIEAYKKKTKNDLRSHPLLDKLQNCHSPGAVMSLLYEQIPGFDQSRDADAKLTKWLNPTVNVLCTFSGVIGGGVGLVSTQEPRIKVVPYLMIDWHTGIPTGCSDLCWNRCPSLSEFYLNLIYPILIVIPNFPRRLRPFLIVTTCLPRSSSA